MGSSFQQWSYECRNRGDGRESGEAEAYQMGLRHGEDSCRRFRSCGISSQMLKQCNRSGILHGSDFAVAAISGRHWALLPSAAGFVDPLLSTGFPLTLLGVSRLAEMIERDWGTENFDIHLERYAAETDADLLATSRLIALYMRIWQTFPFLPRYRCFILPRRAFQKPHGGWGSRNSHHLFYYTTIRSLGLSLSGCWSAPEGFSAAGNRMN